MKINLSPVLLSVFILSVALFQISCSKAEEVAFEVVDVLPAEVAKQMDKESIVVLDVRTPQEVAMGRIPGSINIDINSPDFADGVAKLDPSKSYMVHCAAGSPGGRSRRSIDALESIGVKKVYHLEGGFAAWQAANNQTEVPES